MRYSHEGGVISHEERWKKGAEGVKRAVVKMEEKEVSEEVIKAQLPKWQNDFGFTALHLNTKESPWMIEGEMSKRKPVAKAAPSFPTIEKVFAFKEFPDSIKHWAKIELDKNKNKIKGLNLTSLREWFKERDAFDDPLGGSLNEAFWGLMYKRKSEILNKGIDANFNEPEFFGMLEKKELELTVKSGGADNLKARLHNLVFKGTNFNANKTVKEFVSNLDSSKISHETNAKNRAPFHQFGKWEDKKLSYAYPKHVSWKDTDLSKKAGWQMQEHHIWPKYLMGPDMLVDMHQKLHLVHFHRIDEAIVPSSLGIDSRSSSLVKKEYRRAKRLKKENDFIQTIRDSLKTAYNIFQSSHVVSGNFASYCIDKINSIKNQDLNLPTP